MADSKISTLPVLTVSAPSDAFAVVQGGVTKQQSREQITGNLLIQQDQVGGLADALALKQNGSLLLDQLNEQSAWASLSKFFVWEDGILNQRTIVSGADPITVTKPLNADYAIGINQSALTLTQPQVTGLTTALDLISSNQSSDHNQIVINTADIVNLGADVDTINDQILTIGEMLDTKANISDAMLRGLQQVPVSLGDLKALDGAYVGADIISANKNAISGIYFTNGIDSAANFKIEMPKRWNGGSVGFRVHIAANTGASGTARFRLYMISRVSAGTFNQAFTTYASTAVNFNGLGDVYDIMISNISDFITPAGSISNPCQLELRLVRTGADTVNDTITVPVIVEKLSLFYTADKGNDA